MKKKLLKWCMPVLIFLVAVIGISMFKKENSELENFENDEIVLKKSRFKDGMWHTDKHSYKYKLNLKGKLPKAEEEIEFIVLSNSDLITFDDVSSSLFNKKSSYKEEEFILAEIKKCVI